VQFFQFILFLFFLENMRPRCKPKKMTPKYRNFRLNFEISQNFERRGCVNQTMKNSKNFILRIFLETKTTFSLFFTRHNFALVHEIFGRFFNIHRVKSIQKSLNYRTSTDSIVFDRCRRARARVSIFDEFRNFFRVV
jgi:hypothetical protein